MQRLCPRPIERCLDRVFYKTEIKIWAVGCGLGWTVLKKVWADYEQLLRVCFSTFCGQKKKKKIENIVASAPQFYIQLVFKAPLCITLTISDQKIVSGSLFFQLFLAKKKKKKKKKS